MVKLIEIEMQKRNIDGEVVATGGFTEDVEGETEIDITLKLPSRNYEVEVRSSCMFQRLKKGLTDPVKGFGLLGWYTTAAKRKEIKKDIYLSVIFNFSPELTLEMIHPSAVYYLVGGVYQVHVTK